MTKPTDPRPPQNLTAANARRFGAGGCQAGQVAQPSHVREVTTPGTVVHRPERLQQLSEGEGSKVD